MQHENFFPLMEKVFREVRWRFFSLGTSDKAIAASGVAFGDLHQDTELEADKKIGSWLRELLSDTSLPIVRITIEGSEDVQLAPADEAGYWVAVDPLDGSLNYAQRGSSLGLPMTCVITILKVNGQDEAHFSDIMAAGVLDFRNGDMMLASQTSVQFSTINEWKNTSHELLLVDPLADLDISHQIIFAENYYPEMREKIAAMFVGEKGWIRNPGSAAYEMMMVGYGSAVAYLSDRQKQHELGAGYLFMKARGGVALDWEGNKLDNRPYTFNVQTPCLLAVTPRIGQQLLERIRRL